MKGRIKNTVTDLKENDIRNFFDKRCKEADFNGDDERYAITMLHESDVSKKRDAYEKETVLPLLNISEKTTVIDMGCGVGRWADLFKNYPIIKYTGIDFSQECINICKSVFKNDSRFDFHCGRIQNLDQFVDNDERYNLALINGVLLNINDSDLPGIFKIVDYYLESGAILFIKDSVATDYRLTLDNYRSPELNSNYNAIYRPLDFWMKLFDEVLPNSRYEMVRNDHLYRHLNDRKETSHYYWVLKKK